MRFMPPVITLMFVAASATRAAQGDYGLAFVDAVVAALGALQWQKDWIDV